MMNWLEVWNKRTESDESDILLKLIKADGFDSDAGSINRTAWEEYVLKIMNKMQMEDYHSVFEIGCGSGAFLYPMFERGLWVSGCDYSESLISIARKYINDSFFVASAEYLHANPQYNHVIANSTFQYFPSLDYAKNVARIMIEKSFRKIGILDINDKSKEDYAKQMRSSMSTNNDYEKKYEGLEHLFIHKDWWKVIAREFDCDIVIEDQSVKDYGNCDFRYNVFLTKKIK